MSAELGRFEKPEAEPMRAERKIYLVPLLPPAREMPPGYEEKAERYWIGVREHVTNLENRIGAVQHVYHESIPFEGSQGLSLVERANPQSFALARQMVEHGAHFEALEDQEILSEAVDWQRCLMLGLISRKVADQVYGFYRDANQQRNEKMQQRIDETLKPADAGVLFINENHHLQFPPDIQVFYVAPPALDEIHRWLREQEAKAEAQEAAAEPEAEAAPEAPAEGESGEPPAEGASEGA